MSADAVVAAITARGVVAIVRDDDRIVARELAVAAEGGGIELIEVTMTVPGALALVAELVADGAKNVGLGTVLDAHAVTVAAKAGATFVVTPAFDPEVVAAARDHDLLAIPGVFTPTEVNGARRAGLRMIKLFPAMTVGPSYLRALRSVYPDIAVVPTGGIDQTNATDWLDAGAIALGLGSALNRAHRRGGPTAVTELARSVLDLIDQRHRAHRDPSFPTPVRE